MTDRELFQKVRAVLENVQITGPDDDGVLWINLPGNGTTGKAILRVGNERRIAAQCAKLLEADRSEALAALRERLSHCDRCGKKLGGPGDIHTCSPQQPMFHLRSHGDVSAEELEKLTQPVQPDAGYQLRKNMNTQPEALRLANHLDLFRSFPDDLAAAAELRRLYAINKKLLGALKLIANTDPVDAALDPQRAVRIAHVALAKAQGEKT